MNELIYAKAKVLKGEGDTMRIVASTEAIDRDGEIIKLDGWDLRNFKTNPVFLWAHNYRELPLGKFLSISKNLKDRQLEGKIKWATYDENPFAPFVKAQYESGIMGAFSVGFIPRERDEDNPSIITKAELLEVSAVPVPSNPHALMMLSAKGFGDKTDKVTFDVEAMRQFVNRDTFNPNELADFIQEVWSVSKAVVPFKSYPLLDKGVAWDASKAKKNMESACMTDDRMDFMKYSKGFAWFDNEKKDTLGAYKLPHHDYQDKLVTNWRGVVAAMGAILGARGGVSLPENDKKAVYNHLAKHYKEFGEEPPKLSDYSEAELKEMFGEEGKDGGNNLDAGNDGEGEAIRTEEKTDMEKDNQADNQPKISQATKDIINNATAALQGLLAGSGNNLENSESIDDLPTDEKEGLKTLLKVGKLLAEEIMRKLNSAKRER